jgi:hypothetical protein
VGGCPRTPPTTGPSKDEFERLPAVVLQTPALQVPYRDPDNQLAALTEKYGFGEWPQAEAARLERMMEASGQRGLLLGQLCALWGPPAPGEHAVVVRHRPTGVQVSIVIGMPSYLADRTEAGHVLRRLDALLASTTPVDCEATMLGGSPMRVAWKDGRDASQPLAPDDALRWAAERHAALTGHDRDVHQRLVEVLWAEAGPAARADVAVQAAMREGIEKTLATIDETTDEALPIFVGELDAAPEELLTDAQRTRIAAARDRLVRTKGWAEMLAGLERCTGEPAGEACLAGLAEAAALSPVMRVRIPADVLQKAWRTHAATRPDDLDEVMVRAFGPPR